MVIGGLTTFLWDGHLKPQLFRFKARRRHENSSNGLAEEAAEGNVVELDESSSRPDLIHRRINASSSKQPFQAPSDTRVESSTHALPDATPQKAHTVRVRVGIPIIMAFFGKYRSLLCTFSSLLFG
jgi:hypothetical protein